MGEDGEVKAVFPPSGQVARVKPERIKVAEINGIPVYHTSFGVVEGLPEPQPGTIYIVSTLVLAATKNRNDLVAPDTSPASAVRDDNGRIIGVRAFQVL